MTLPPKISISGHSGTGSGSLAAVRTNYIGRLSWTYSSLVVAVLSYVGLKLAHNPVKMATLSATSLICLTKNDFGIIQGALSVGYINGTLLQKAKSRAKNPDPTNIDGEYDDSDYLAEANGKSLRPGVILECRNIPTDDHGNDSVTWTNSVAKVYRRDDVRITCAKHGWDGVEDKNITQGSVWVPSQIVF